MIPIKIDLNKLQLEPTTEIEIFDNEILVGYFNIKYALRVIIFPQKGSTFFRRIPFIFMRRS